jgi:hypothetical protein
MVSVEGWASTLDEDESPIISCTFRTVRKADPVIVIIKVMIISDWANL